MKQKIAELIKDHKREMADLDRRTEEFLASSSKLFDKAMAEILAALDEEFARENAALRKAIAIQSIGS